MDLTGLGVLIIGIAVLIFAIFLAKVLNSFSKVIDSVDSTVQTLPKQIDAIMDETSTLLHNSNNTLTDVNEKLGTLTPIFNIVGDVGESTRTISSSLVDVTAAMKRKRDDKITKPEVKSKRLGGLYGTTALSYYLFNKKRDKVKVNNLYEEGQVKALELEDMKSQAKM